MDRTDYLISKFDDAIMLMPNSLRERFRRVIRTDREKTEEIRLRRGKRPSILLPDGELFIGDEPVTKGEIDGVLEITTRASMHSVKDSIRLGYITSSGGYRIGICGTAVLDDCGSITGFRVINSLSIRIPHEITGVADELMNKVITNGRFISTLILSPPGFGKTTLLRDMVRILSDRGMRVSLADERGEIAGVYEGKVQLDVGCRTDVIDGCRKSEAVMMMLRSMNPQIIAMDEITSPKDCEAAETAHGCGVGLLATAHAESPEDMAKRPVYRRLIDAGIFKKYVVIYSENGKRRYEVFDMEEIPC